MSLTYVVIGCGEHGIKGHIRPGRALGLELAGVFDPSTVNAQQAVKASGCPQAQICSSEEEVLALPGVQAVVIASLDEFHPAQLMQTVEAGLHVLVDKPLALDEAGLRLVREALAQAATQGLVVVSCHPRRFDPPYVWVKDNLPWLVEQFGRVVRLEMDFSYHRPTKPWKAARSLLLDHFPHEIDFARWLLGEAPLEAHRLDDGFDAYSVVGRRADDVTLVFSGTRRLQSSIYPEQVHVRFDRGECMVNIFTGRHRAYPEILNTLKYQGRPQ